MKFLENGTRPQPPTSPLNTGAFHAMVVRLSFGSTSRNPGKNHRSFSAEYGLFYRALLENIMGCDAILWAATFVGEIIGLEFDGLC